VSHLLNDQRQTDGLLYLGTRRRCARCVVQSLANRGTYKTLRGSSRCDGVTRDMEQLWEQNSPTMTAFLRQRRSVNTFASQNQRFTDLCKAVFSQASRSADHVGSALRHSPTTSLNLNAKGLWSFGSPKK
jgi:hypothetical protein